MMYYTLRHGITPACRLYNIKTPATLTCKQGWLNIFCPFIFLFHVRGFLVLPYACINMFTHVDWRGKHVRSSIYCYHGIYY